MSRLFHVSDVHFGCEDTAAVEGFTRLVQAEQPDAVLMTGDLTMRAKPAEFAAAGVWLKSLGVPVTVEVGNHDLPYSPLRFFRPYARYGQVERAVEAQLTLADTAVIPLQTTARFQWRLNWSHGYIAQGRLRDAVAAVRAVPDGRVRIVACHHPLLADPNNPESRTIGGDEALHALADVGADVVLSGHVHDAFDRMWTGGARPLRLVGAGTLSKRTRNSPPTFNEIVVGPSGVEVIVREVR